MDTIIVLPYLLTVVIKCFGVCHVPCVVLFIGVSRSRPPWISKDVSRYIRRRDRLANLAKKSRSLIDRQRFRKARNQASQITKDAYQKYLNNVLGNVSDDARAFYCFIKNKRTDSTGVPSLITSSGLAVLDSDKASTLNKYFASVFTQENSDHFSASYGLIPDMPAIEVTSPGVLKMLLGLNIKKSIGPDEISPYVLKEAALEFCPILTYIFNRLENARSSQNWIGPIQYFSAE